MLPMCCVCGRDLVFIYIIEGRGVCHVCKENYDRGMKGVNKGLVKAAEHDDKRFKRLDAELKEEIAKRDKGD